VLDVFFPSGRVPEMLNRLVAQDGATRVNMEIAQHLGEATVRCIAMEATEELYRGMRVYDTGSPITVPVGDGLLGRAVDALGRSIDGNGEIKAQEYWPIHRPAPALAEQQPVTSLFETGIKVIDLLEPYAKGGKIGLFGGAGVGERSREGNDMLREMVESGMIEKTALAFGQPQAYVLYERRVCRDQAGQGGRHGPDGRMARGNRRAACHRGAREGRGAFAPEALDP
jgi:F-type H+-transporting ATPase subunit beta